MYFHAAWYFLSHEVIIKQHIYGNLKQTFEVLLQETLIRINNKNKRLIINTVVALMAVINRKAIILYLSSQQAT